MPARLEALGDDRVDPARSSHRASSTVVADEITFAPQPRTRASSSADGSPKWKLTTAGRTPPSTSAASALNGARPARGDRARSSPSSS